MPGIDVETAVRLFCEAWNTADDDAREQLLAECCTQDSQFSSPHGPSLDFAGLSRSIKAFLTAFPNAEVTFGPPDSHHSLARFRWRTRFNDDERAPIFGDDFVEFADDGRINRVVSFDGVTPEI